MANNQQIPLSTIIYFDNLSDPENPRKMARAGLVRQAVIVADKLLQNICHHSNMKYAEVVTAMAALPNAIADYVSAGHAVQIKDLFTIKPSFKVSARDTAAECSVDDIKSVGVSIQPIGKLRELSKLWKFRMTNRVVDLNNKATGGAVPSESPSTVNVVFAYKSGRQVILTGVPGSPLTAPALTDSETRWSPRVPEVFPQKARAFREIDEADARVIYEFEFADGTIDTLQGYEGDAVNAPANTTGYHWPEDVPAEYGTEWLHFVEVADGSQNTGNQGGNTGNQGGSSGNTGSQGGTPASGSQVTLTYTFHDGRQETFSGNPGDSHQAPTNTSGYMWSPSPKRVFPDSDASYTEVEDTGW